MKGIFILSVLLFAGASFAVPVEMLRWQLTPNSDGKLHLVDTAAVEDVESFWNPATDVFFVLWTRRNPTAGQRLARTTASINNSHWNTGSQVRFMIHGWQGSHTSQINTALRPQYLANANHNVIGVDWSAANSIVYATSRGRVEAAGVQVASFIDWLHLNGFITNFNQVILAGHSLGAHVAGMAGKRLSRGRAQAIFGLDPAGPSFSWLQPSQRLASGDAVYTEMIATNIGNLGFDQPIGAASFYPHWGGRQPGCLTDSCDHSRCIPLYAESITSARFVARRCSGWSQIDNRNCPVGQGTAVMGGDAAKSLTGVFFLTTNSGSPHAQG